MKISTKITLTKIIILMYALQFSSNAWENQEIKIDSSLEKFSQNRDSNQSISYTESLQKWKSFEDVNIWITENFEYDPDRAKQLANNKTDNRTKIYEPMEFFNRKKGVCVDLAHFTVKTLRSIIPDINAKYLMIEFEPFKIGENTFRNHWLVVYESDGNIFTMADSKRPGYIDGPYNDISDFVSGYQKFRKRKIISYEIKETFKREMKKRSLKKYKYNQKQQ